LLAVEGGDLSLRELVMSVIEDKKLSVEALAMSITVIVGIAAGLSNQGSKVIKIYIDRPFSQINLPNELRGDEFDFEFIGDVSAN